MESELVAAAFEDDVFLRSRCRLNRVGGRLPTEAVMVLFRTFYCEVLHRQGLHHKLAGFAFGHESSEGFVDRASDRESESGIKAVLHVGEVLMAHKLYKRRGHFRDACLDIRLVPHGAACPPGFVCLADVACDLAHHHIGEHSGVDARCAVLVAVASVGEINAERAHKAVVGAFSGIGMQCEADIDRNVEAFGIGQHA